VNRKSEKFLTVKQAAAMMSPPVAPITAWRWMRQGIVLNGEVVRLKAKRQGTRWMTTNAWIDEFIRRCEEAIG